MHKCIKDQQMYINFIDLSWLQSDHQHVLATHVGIFNAIFWQQDYNIAQQSAL